MIIGFAGDEDGSAAGVLGGVGPVTVRTENLQRAFGAENAMPLSVWTYSTPDPLEEVLAPGYFRGCRRAFRLGDLVICATDEPEDRCEIDGKRDRRRALLMVTSLHHKTIETRLVQDWGSPEGAPGAKPARPRKRVGRLRHDPTHTVAMPLKRRRSGACAGGCRCARKEGSVMAGVLGSIAAVFRRGPAGKDRPAAIGGDTAGAPKRRRGAAQQRRAGGRAAMTEAGLERLAATIERRFDELDAAMAARAQAQVLTLAQLIGEAIVAECRALRVATVGGTAGPGAAGGTGGEAGMAGEAVGGRSGDGGQPGAAASPKAGPTPS